MYTFMFLFADKLSLLFNGSAALILNRAKINDRRQEDKK